MNEIELIKTFTEHTSSILTLCILDDGTIISGSKDGRLCFWNDGICTYSTDDNRNPLWNITKFSYENEEYVVARYDSGDITIWKNKVCVLKNHETFDNVVKIVQLDEDYKVSINREHRIRIWKNDKNISNFLTQYVVKCITLISSEDSTFATGTEDGEIQIWNRKNCLQKIQGHTASVNCIEYNNKTKEFVSGSDDGSICIWNSDLSMRKKKILTGKVKALVLIEDENCIVSGEEDGCIKCWKNLVMVAE